MSDLIQLGAPNARPKAPKAEELELRFSETAMNEIAALLKHYPDKKSCILPGLWIAQREYGGYLDGPAIAEVAYHLQRSYAEVEGVATFYSMYNTRHAVGRHMIEVCTCLSCQVCGAYPVAEYLKKKLGVDFGETTDDGIFTLHEVECLNACDRAPVIQVGDQYYGSVNEQSLDQLLDELRNNPNSTVTQMANEVVQVHLGDHEAPWRDWTPRLSDTYYDSAQPEKPAKKSTSKKQSAAPAEPVAGAQPEPSTQNVAEPEPKPEPEPEPPTPPKGRITVDESA